jgi:hypothetical protein
MFISDVVHSVIQLFNSRIKNLMKEAPTAYSLLIMHRDVIYAVRDPYGNRPLCIGRLIPVSDINDKGNELQKKYFLFVLFLRNITFIIFSKSLSYNRQAQNLWLEEGYG